MKVKYDKESGMPLTNEDRFFDGLNNLVAECDLRPYEISGLLRFYEAFMIQSVMYDGEER
jgi:hypothetical protein